MFRVLFILFFPIMVFGSLSNISSFEADFKQSITDEKNKVLTYQGHIVALKPYNAFWHYTSPVDKSVYISSFNVLIIEPEIEQVIIKKLSTDFNFFQMIKKAKQIKNNVYETYYKDIKFTLVLKKDVIVSISYIDQFENKIKIEFTNQIENKKIDKKIFFPKIPNDFDIIRE